MNVNNNKGFLCTNIFEDQAQGIKQSCYHKQYASHQWMDESVRKVRIGSSRGKFLDASEMKLYLLLV